MASLIFPGIPESSRFGAVSGFPFFPNFPAPYGGRREKRENGREPGKPQGAH